MLYQCLYQAYEPTRSLCFTAVIPTGHQQRAFIVSRLDLFGEIPLIVVKKILFAQSAPPIHFNMLQI